MARQTANRPAARRRAAAAAAAVPAGRVKTSEERQAENIFLGVLLVLLTLIVFIPAFNAGFIWDDDQLLTANPQVHSPDGWWTLWLRPLTADYFPLTSTTLWFEWRLWGLNPSGYHVTNVIFHAIVVLLTWRTLVRLKVPGAWFAAAIFAIHPVCVESVAWISERKNSISQIFFLLSIMSYLKFDETGKRKSYIASVVMFVLSLLAKTSVVMLPFVLLLLSWWRKSDKPPGELKATLIREARRMVPFFIAAFVLGIITVYFQYGRAIGGEEIPLGNLWQRMASACFAAGFYLYSAVWPFNIIEIYPQWHRAFTLVVTQPKLHVDPPAPESIPYWIQVIPGLLIAGLLYYCWTQRTKAWARAIFVALGVYFLAMLPALGLLKMSYMRLTLVADHFQYISIAAVIALFVGAGARRMLNPVLLCLAALCFCVPSVMNWGITQDNHYLQILWVLIFLLLAAGVAMKELWTYIWNGFLVVVLLCFGIMSFTQAETYHSEETLWSATLAKNPITWQGHNHLGAALYMRGDVRAAYPHFAAAVRLKPENPESHNNLGLALMQFGQMDEAIHQYETAVGIKDDSAMRTNLANAYAQVKNMPKAIENYQHAIQLNPDNASAHCNLGYAYMLSGKIDDAMQEFERTLMIDPQMPQARRDLEEAMRIKGLSSPPPLQPYPSPSP